MMPASVKPLRLRKGPAGTASSETRQKAASFTSAFPGELPGNLENDFQLDRGTERKACDAIHQAARALVFSEDVLQQLRSAIGHFRLIADISRSGHRHAEPDDARHFFERSQMLQGNGQRV